MNRRNHLKLCLVFVVFVYATASSTRSDVGAQQDQRPATPPTQPEDKPAEQVYKNIQVMKGVPSSRLLPAMNRLTQFLGVDCAHCHVPDALDKDDKPQKQTARKMFQMVRTINTTLNTNRVTCYTCHRAQARPATPPKELTPTDEERQRAEQDQRPAEQVYKNIQTLKGAITAGRLMMAMQMFTKSLGVDCAHCHVQGEFEKDDKPAKETARRMLRLTGVIAREYYNGSSPINCYTCHRGQTQPASMPPAPANTPPKSELSTPEIKPADAKANVEAILNQYIQALGGRAALERVTTRAMTGTMVTQGGMKAPLEVYEKAPNKTLTIFRPPHGTNQMGFDGAIGWTKTPERGLREERGEPLDLRKSEAEFYKELKLKERYSKLTLLGLAQLDNREAYVIEAAPPRGQPEKLYFDRQSGLLVRVDIVPNLGQEKMQMHIYFEDYRAVDGVKLPFAIRRARPGFTWTYQFDEIKLNVPLDDARFNKPAVP
ncbi:MAG: photosynthetic reaction center cytochrome c subunit family protein [Blastocatellia bacterium]